MDNRKLNAQTIKNCYPLPRIEDCLDTLAGTQFLSTLDMASGYWQIDIAPENRHKTAFITGFGLFEHVRLAFGLCNAPATYQRAMQLVRGLLWHTALVYTDDVVVLGVDFESALANLRVVLELLRVNNLKLKPKKCALLQKQVRYLGRLVSPDGISIADEHVLQIRNWPIPRTRQELESFLGFMNYHREFFRGFAETTDPLYKLAASVPNGRSVLDMSDKYLGIIESLKLALIEAPILPYPDVDSMFILDCDASHVAIGCALSQVRDGKEVPIAFASYSLIPAQRKYCTTRKELLAVVRFTRLFRHYLLGRRFVVRTDHNSLRWLFSFSYVEGQLARWQEELESYDMEIVHRPGKLHTTRMRYLVFRMWILFVLIIILVFLLRVFLVLRTVRIVTSVRKPMRNGLILLMKSIIFFCYLFDKFQQRLLQMFLWRCFLYRHGFLHIPWMIYVRHRWMTRIFVLLFLGWRMMFSLPETN